MQYFEELEEAATRKYKKREKRRRPRFKVSGRQILKLKEIVGKKAQN